MALPWEVSDHELKKQLLEKAVELFKEDTSLTPVMGAELEFYLTPDIPVCLETLAGKLQEQTISKSLPPLTIEKERGDGQYEVQVDHSADILSIAHTIQQLPAILAAEMPSEQKAVFTAKPFPDQPGNSLHIHIGLFDDDDTNILMRVTADGQKEESPAMQQAIAGLLDTMQESIAIFAPTDDDYARFTPKLDAPTTISWGGNNRTCALRIPASSWLLEPTRHIEHRVPASNADPYLTMIAILAGIHHGITQELTPAFAKTYGDASMEMYNLETFPNNAKKARKLNKKGKTINRFFARCQKAL